MFNVQRTLDLGIRLHRVSKEFQTDDKLCILHYKSDPDARNPRGSAVLRNGLRRMALLGGSTSARRNRGIESICYCVITSHNVIMSDPTTPTVHARAPPGP